MKKIVLSRQLENCQDKITFAIHDSMSDILYPNVNITFSATFTRENGEKISRVYGKQQTIISWLDFWINYFLKDGYAYLKK